MKNITLLICVFIIRLSYAQEVLPITEDLTFKLQQEITKSKFQNISVAILFPNDSIWRGYKGIRKDSSLIDAHTLYNIGSVTKNFVAACVLQFVDNGKLSLDDTLYKFIPVIKNVSYGITIRMLLNHSTGLNDFTGNDDYLLFNRTHPDTILKPEEILNKFLHVPHHKPGVRSYDYCNTNFVLTGMVLSQICGLTLSKLLHQYVYEPANLTDTYIFPDSLTQNLVQSGNNKASTKAALNSVGPAGAMYSTPTDMVLWQKNLYKAEFITQSSLQEMLIFHKIFVSETIGSGPEYDYGLGTLKIEFKRFETTTFSWGHIGGWANGSDMFYFPKDDLSIAVCYETPSGEVDLIQNLYDVVLGYERNAQNIRSFKNDVFNLYPNPTNGNIQFTSNISSNEACQLKIMDYTSRLILTHKIQKIKQGETISINLSNKPAGIYLVRLRAGKEEYSGKVVLVK
jgi:CubicO group peptidase (beta-lactamase class C family)